MEKYEVLLGISIIIFSALLTKRIIMNNKKHKKQRAKLPPGSMGLPYIGETLQLYSQDPNIFFSDRHTRYGEIFKTRMLGYPCVMLASPEAAHFVLVARADLFKPTYPKSKEDLIGPNALFFHEGDYHMRLRKMVQRCLNPEAIRGFVPDIEAIAASALDSWLDGQVLCTYTEMKKFSFEVGVMAIFGDLEDHHKEELKKNYCIVEKGYNSFPTRFPGSPYNNALKARKKLREIISKIIRERKGNDYNKSKEKGLLSSFMNSKDESAINLNEDQIADNIIGVLFAAQDTTASALIWIIKYLHDNPKLLECVKAEQKMIRQSNDVEGTHHLTWRNTRQMPTTHKVVLETLRISSIISFTFREAVADVEYKGYLIPKGWKVMPLFRNIHHSPDFFSDPHKFDPSRFEKAQKPNTFMPFGSGVHACPGNELAKLEMLIMTHHLVTKFRWELVGPKSGIQYGPFPVPINGLPARFWRESQT